MLQAEVLLKLYLSFITASFSTKRLEIKAGLFHFHPYQYLSKAD